MGAMYPHPCCDDDPKYDRGYAEGERQGFIKCYERLTEAFKFYPTATHPFDHHEAGLDDEDFDRFVDLINELPDDVWEFMEEKGYV